MPGSPWAPEAAHWVLILIQEETWASLVEGVLKSILVNLSVSQGPNEEQQWQEGCLPPPRHSLGASSIWGAEAGVHLFRKGLLTQKFYSRW